MEDEVGLGDVGVLDVLVMEQEVVREEEEVLRTVL